jgi:hypothetical protein
MGDVSDHAPTHASLSRQAGIDPKLVTINSATGSA